jgi:hypothetical protein
MIDKDMEKMLSKCWNQIPICMKKQILALYCTENNIDISSEVFYQILKDKSRVVYEKSERKIKSIMINK